MAADLQDKYDLICFMYALLSLAFSFISLDPTKIVIPPQDVQIISGTTAQLMCQAEYDKSLRGAFEVVWRKDGEEIPLSFEENSR